MQPSEAPHTFAEQGWYSEKTCLSQSTQRTQRKTNQTGFTGLGGFYRDLGIVSKTSLRDVFETTS